MRKKVIMWLYTHSSKIYTTWFKKTPAWNISRQELLQYPPESLGYHLGCFLKKHDFELIPKGETHDIYHLLNGYGISVEDEIALQYLCFANGKRSAYLLGAITLGTLILPDYASYYYKSYIKGKQAHPFHDLDYHNLLKSNYQELQDSIFQTSPCKKPSLTSSLNRPSTHPQLTTNLRRLFP